jgi:hypothetical protein
MPPPSTGTDLSPRALLAAINALRARALPGARPYELRHGVDPLARPLDGAATVLADRGGLQEVAVLDTVPLTPPAPGYWGPGKAALWAGLLGVSLLFWAWDAGLGDRWEAWQLARRVRLRREGKRAFSAAENVDDILSLLLARGVRDAAEAAADRSGDQRLGWRRLPREDTAAATAAAAAAAGFAPPGGGGGDGGGWQAARQTGHGGRAAPPGAGGMTIDVAAEAPASESPAGVQDAAGGGGGSAAGAGAAAQGSAPDAAPPPGTPAEG